MARLHLSAIPTDPDSDSSVTSHQPNVSDLDEDQILADSELLTVGSEPEQLFPPTAELGRSKDITYWHGVCLIMSRQIGATIFSAPSVVNGKSASIGMSLVAWFIGGLISYQGARIACRYSMLIVVTYVHLGCAMPLNGGAHAYLHKIYGSFPSCLFAWALILVLKPVSVAVVCLLFGQYFVRLLFLSPVLSDSIETILLAKFVGLISLWCVIAIVTGGSFLVAKVNSFLTVVKLAFLASIPLFGAVIACTHFN